MLMVRTLSKGTTGYLHLMKSRIIWVGTLLPLASSSNTFIVEARTRLAWVPEISREAWFLSLERARYSRDVRSHFNYGLRTDVGIANPSPLYDIPSNF